MIKFPSVRFPQFAGLSLQVLLCILILPGPQTVWAARESGHGPWTAKTAVDYALKNSPDSRIARIRIEAARAEVEKAKSGLYPKLFLNSEYSQTDNALYSFGNILNQGTFDNTINFNDPGRTDDLKIEAEMRYRLYSGGADDAAVAMARHSQQKNSSEYHVVINQLAFEVVRSFQHIVLAEEMVQARNSALEAIRASLTVARARYQAGELLRQQLLDLEVQEARASEDLIQADHTLILSHHAFNNLLGITGETVQIIKDGSANPVLPGKLDYAARPELAAIDSMIASAGDALVMARAGYKPEVDSFAGYRYDYGFINDGDGNSWIAGVRLSYPLFDGGLRDGEIDRRQAVVAELMEQKRKVRLQLDYELQQAKQELEQAEERIGVTSKMLTLAEESARLSRARFKEGVILSSDLIDIEMRLTDVQVRNSRARVLQTIAVANLRRIVGLPQF